MYISICQLIQAIYNMQVEKFGVVVKVADGTREGRFLKYRGIIKPDLTSKFLHWLDYNFPRWVYVNCYQKKEFKGSITNRDRVLRDRRTI